MQLKVREKLQEKTNVFLGKLAVLANTFEKKLRERKKKKTEPENRKHLESLHPNLSFKENGFEQNYSILD